MERFESYCNAIVLIASSQTVIRLGDSQRLDVSCAASEENRYAIPLRATYKGDKTQSGNEEPIETVFL